MAPFEFENFDRWVVRMSSIFMLIVGMISPFFIAKTYVYFLSPACAIGLTIIAIRHIRRRS